MMTKYIVSIIFAIIILIDGTRSQMTNSTMGDPIGAVYTMSNGMMMNQIIVNRLYSTGMLEAVSMVNTNGTGVNTIEPDPLFSQGSLQVYSNCIFAVNALSNTLSMLTIDRMNATNVKLTSVKEVYGSFPISVAVNSMYACVLTGGMMTGIRCFTYNSSGLYVVSSFDRNLTSYVSQTTPPNGPANTMSQISFSSDNRSLIVLLKGYNMSLPGCVLSYLFTDPSTLSAMPIMQVLNNSGFPFSLTLVNMYGLLITDPVPKGVFTMNYTSMNGTISNSQFTMINSTLAGALCWSTYSPKTGNYYIIGSKPASVVELRVNLSATMNPVNIVQYYQIPDQIGALDATVATVNNIDHLFIVGVNSHTIRVYRLNSSGNALAIGNFTTVQGNTSLIPKLAGIASYIQMSASVATTSAMPTQSTTSTMRTQSTTSSSARLISSLKILVMIHLMYIYVSKTLFQTST